MFPEELWRARRIEHVDLSRTCSQVDGMSLFVALQCGSEHAHVGWPLVEQYCTVPELQGLCRADLRVINTQVQPYLERVTDRSHVLKVPLMPKRHECVTVK